MDASSTEMSLLIEEAQRKEGRNGHFAWRSINSAPPFSTAHSASDKSGHHSIVVASYRTSDVATSATISVMGKALGTNTAQISP